MSLFVGRGFRRARQSAPSPVADGGVVPRWRLGPCRALAARVNGLARATADLPLFAGGPTGCGLARESARHGHSADERPYERRVATSMRGVRGPRPRLASTWRVLGRD